MSNPIIFTFTDEDQAGAIAGDIQELEGVNGILNTHIAENAMDQVLERLYEALQLLVVDQSIFESEEHPDDIDEQLLAAALKFAKDPVDFVNEVLDTALGEDR